MQYAKIGAGMVRWFVADILATGSPWFVGPGSSSFLATCAGIGGGFFDGMIRNDVLKQILNFLQVVMTIMPLDGS